MSILEKINSSDSVKELKKNEIKMLCDELRHFIIDNVAKTGGHLASNLGTVELTVALHRIYNTSKDRLIFDVGHQSYTHKIITGRRDDFSTLRQLGGISGFPKPYESNDDAFIAGHASNSVSVALGMARARTLSRADYDVVAVIGDGALTGGLAYEGLADAAASGEPIVIVLNDNNMSISENVGGMARMLQYMRLRPGYINFKRIYRRIFGKFHTLYNFIHKIKEWFKSWLLPENIFSELGLYYLGPVDGHDVRNLEAVIGWAKEMKAPVLVHVLTRKGKGCGFAEIHPDKYHGVGPFDPYTGEVKNNEKGYSDKFGEFLCEFAEEDENICAITAAMTSGTGLDDFASRFPARFFDVGIAEGHGVAMSAGMAKQGIIPVFAVYSTFLQRGYDMLIHDVALSGLHTVFAVDRAGVVGNDGETHNGVFDVNYLCSAPGMTILCPSSYSELHDMLKYALYCVDGPVAVRYPRGGEGEYTQSHIESEFVLREGSDVTIVCYGDMVNEAVKASEMLSLSGISAEIVKLGIIKPANFKLAIASAEKTGRLIIAESVCAAGCVGEQILSAVIQKGAASVPKAKLLNLGSGIVVHGNVSELMHRYGIDAEAISSAAKEMLCEKVVF